MDNAGALLKKAGGGAAGKNYVLFTAVAAVGMMLVIYTALGIWPMGGGTVLTGDLRQIYINFFAHFKRAFFGQAGFAYGFDKGLGGGLIGLFAYYVSSPFNIIYLFVPERWFAVAASVVLLLKITLACVFFHLYIRHRYPGLGAGAVGPALCYGFMAYSFAYAQNIMWHDVLLLLPLACLGVERIIEGKPFTLYATMLALAIFANFYIAFMACIFMVLYFLWAMLTRPVEQRKAGWAGWKGPLWRFGAGSLLAGGLNAAFLLPALSNINQNKGALFSYSFSLEPLFSLARLPGRLVVGAFSFADVQGHLPFVYCGTLVLLLCVCYFAAKGIALREKLLSAGVILLFLLSFWINGLDTLWHAFKAPVWFPARYSFLFCFFLVGLAARALAKGAAAGRALPLAAGILAVFYLVLLFLPGAAGRRHILLTLGLMLVCFACLMPWNRIAGMRFAKTLPMVVLVVAVAGELVVNGVYITNRFEKYPLSGVQAFVDDAGGTIDAIQAADGGDYRIADSYYSSLNDAMLLGYRGIAHFASTQDGPAQQVLYGLGYRNYGGAGPYLYGGTAFADSVLGMKYLAADGARPVPAHWQAADMGTPYAVYQNPYALPMLFAAPMDTGLAAGTEADGDMFDYQNGLYASLGGQGALLQDADATLESAQGAALPLCGDVPAGAAYTVTARQPGYCYAFFTSPEQNIAFSINGGPAQETLHPLNGGVLDLGFLEKGDSATATLPEGAAISGARFVVLDADKLEALAAQASANGGDFMVRDGHVTGSVRAEAGMALATSIPWEAGWAATVNGREVEVRQWGGGLICLPLDAGENTVELRYHMAGSGALSIGITTGCAAIFAAVLVLPRIRRKKQAG